MDSIAVKGKAQLVTFVACIVILSQVSPVEMRPSKTFTLVFVKRNRQVLLGLKTRGLGAGLWNGFGGKVENKEAVVEAAIRELREESNLVVPENKLQPLGVVTYEEERNPNVSVVYVFSADTYEGDIKPSEEMNPIQWYSYDDIPYNSMWLDAKLWYPLMLKGQCFSAHVGYNCKGFIDKSTITEVDEGEISKQL